MQSSPHSLQLEKAHMQQQRPREAKNKQTNNFTNKEKIATSKFACSIIASSFVISGDY